MSSKTAADHPPFRFIYGTLALNLAGTLANRETGEIERLPSTERLHDWLSETGLLTEDATCNERVLRQMRELRTIVYRALRSAADRRTPARADIDALNAWAAKPPIAERLNPRTLRLSKTGKRGAVMSTIARDALELLGSERRERIRTCEMDACGSIYLDESRGYRRRWCSMEACGNRAKAAAFRSRH